MIRLIPLIIAVLFLSSISLATKTVEQNNFGRFSSRYVSKSSPKDSSYITLELYGMDETPLEVTDRANISVNRYLNRSNVKNVYKVLVPNNTLPRFIYVQLEGRYPIYFKTKLKKNSDIVYRLYLARSPY